MAVLRIQKRHSKIKESLNPLLFRYFQIIIGNFERLSLLIPPRSPIQQKSWPRAFLSFPKRDAHNESASTYPTKERIVTYLH